MDKFREDFKEDFAFLDWLKSLSECEIREYLSKSDIVEDGNDPTIVNISADEFSEWYIKYNFHDASEILEKINNL